MSEERTVTPGHTHTDANVCPTSCPGHPRFQQDEPPLAHDHNGPDSACPACAPLADVLRDRMRWPSLHWGHLHADAYPSMARAVIESDWLAAHVARATADAEARLAAVEAVADHYGRQEHWRGQAIANEIRAALDPAPTTDADTRRDEPTRWDRA